MSADTTDRARSSAAARAGAVTPERRRALLRRLSGQPWENGVTRWAYRSATPSLPVDAVVAVPARDESARIERCLDACAQSIALSGLRVRLLLLVNGTRDGTAARALAWAAARRRSIELIEVDFIPSLAHAGAARRLALELAAERVGPDTPLLTTDADARPAPAWVALCAESLRGGAALVCGRVTLDRREARRLPPAVEASGRLERRYRRASLELAHLIDPDPWNPWPHHGEVSGASLAITARDLLAVGGVPLVPCGEDRALARRVRAHGLPLVHATDVEVEVSCRTAGRAPGGMADSLARRMRDPDPPCDEALEGAAALHARLTTRARLRAAWPSAGARIGALIALGASPPLAAALARLDRFERAWDGFESTVLDAGRRPLRFGALRRELPRLLELVDTVRDREHRARTLAEASAHRRRGPPGSATSRPPPHGSVSARAGEEEPA